MNFLTGSKDVASIRCDCCCIGCWMWLLGITVNPRKSEIDIMVGPSNSAAYAEIRPIPGKNWPIYEKTSQQQKNETYEKKYKQTKYANGENNNLCNIVNHQTRTSTKSTRQTSIIPSALHYQLRNLRNIANSKEIKSVHMNRFKIYQPRHMAKL